MKKLILDTSICIDLYHGKLLKTVLKLKHKIILPDVMMAELEEPTGEFLLKIGFIQEGISGEETKNIIALRNEYASPSTNDLVALYLAKRNACYLITGDNALRNAAEQEDVTAHGLLWLIDEMVRYDILTGNQAAEALGKVIDTGSWLPKKECEERFKKWRR